MFFNLFWLNKKTSLSFMAQKYSSTIPIHMIIIKATDDINQGGLDFRVIDLRV